MTLTEQITERLLDAVEEPDGLDAVYREFSKSRGPYYQALSNATAQLQEQFEATAQENEGLTAHRDLLTEQVAALHDQQSGLEELVQNLASEVLTAEQSLDEAHASLDWIEKLARAGFGKTEFARIHELLGQISAENGGLPEAGVSEFFKFIERFEQVLSLNLEATRAESRAAQSKAEAERWEAEANAREVQSTARISVIDLLEGLLNLGIKGQDFAAWSAVIEKAGVTVEELAVALEAYSGIEALSAARQARADELQSEVSGLEAQVTALAQDRDDAHQAIVAVRDIALGEVNVAEKQARKHINTLFRDATNYGDLKKEAAELGELIDAARVLKSRDLELWKSLPREVIQHALMGSIIWAGGEGRDIQVQAPSAVTQVNSLLTYMNLSLSEVLVWALSGVLTDGQKRASVA